MLTLVALTACSRDAGAPSTSVRSAGPPATLPFTNVSRAELAREVRLAFPQSTDDFLSAQLANRRQLDVTFTLDASDEAAFVNGSKFPALRTGRRVVTHTSPLWKLNPGVPIRGTVDTVRTPNGDRLRRAVEAVDDAGGRVRVRLVVSPA